MEAAVPRARPVAAVLLATFLGCAVLAGIILRFENLAGKVFWQDESYTALHATGHLDHADLRTLFDGKIRTAAELRRLQRVDPDRGLSATISAIAAEDSDQGALYYLLERAAIAIDGGSIVTFRLAGAILGVLTIGAGFALAWELFGSTLLAAVFAAILALSPFEVLYAHEARSYTLTAFMTLLTSWLFVRALSQRNAAGWLLYGLAMAAGLYSSALLVLVAAAHFCYLFVHRRERTAMFGCLGSLALAVLLYSPWLAVLAAHRGMVNTELDWGGTPYPLRLMVEKWLYNANAQFFDLEWLSLRLAPIGAFVLLLMGAALALMPRYSKPKQWHFLAILGILPVVLFVGRDLVQHAHWSTIARYLIPTWLAIQLAVALMLYKWRFRAAGVAVLALLLALEGVSSAVNTRADSWYNDQLSAATPELASVVNTAQNPLIIGEKAWAFFLDAGNYLRPNVHVELFADARNAKIVTSGYSDVYVPTPSNALLQALERQGYTLRLVYAYRSGAAPYTAFHQDLKKNGPKKLPVNGSVSFPENLYAVVKENGEAYKQ